MIKKIEDLNFYELLEVSPSATPQEIHKAYERVRRIYEPNSIALYSLFTPEETALIHQRIEEAYRTLLYEDERRQYNIVLRERNELAEVPPSPESHAYEHRLVPPIQAAPAEEPYSAGPELMPQQEPAPAVMQYSGEFTGPVLKAFREQRGRSLRTIAEMTKVGVRYLEFIEEENFKKLPARTYIRGFLMLYAKALGCNPERVAGDYLKRYDAVMKPPLKK